MIHLLVAHAVASPQGELLRLVEEVDADPVVALSCEPVAPLGRLLESIELPGLGPSKAPEGTWMWMLTPSRLASAGIDVTQSLSVLFFDDRELVVDVGFSGSERQASIVVASLLGLDDETRDNLTWQEGQLLVAGHKLPRNVVDVTLVGGRLTVRAGIPNPGGPTPVRELVRRGNASAGCLLTFDGALPRSEAAQAAGRDALHVTGVLHLPLSDGAPATVRFHTEGPVPTALRSEPAPPVGGSTSERPAVLLSVGVSLGDLLLDPALHRALGIPEEHVIEVLSEMRFGRGSTIGFFEDGPSLGFVANVDAARADGRRLGSRRARRAVQRVLSKIGVTHERVSRNELSVTVRESTVWVTTRPGGLVVGGSRERTREVARGEGVPWVAPAFAELASLHPVAMRSEGVQTGAIPPVAADLGIRTLPGLWEVTLGVHVDDERRAATHSALAATITAIVLPHILPK